MGGDIGLTSSGLFLPVKFTTAPMAAGAAAAAVVGAPAGAPESDEGATAEETGTEMTPARTYAQAIPAGVHQLVGAASADTIKIKVGDTEVEFENPTKDGGADLQEQLRDVVAGKVLAQVNGGIKLLDLVKAPAGVIKGLLTTVISSVLLPLRVFLRFILYYTVHPLALMQGPFMWFSLAVSFCIPLLFPILLLALVISISLATSGEVDTEDAAGEADSAEVPVRMLQVLSESLVEGLFQSR